MAAADSARLLWEVNGHYYQRFEQGFILWKDAKLACEKKSAHLVTITSKQEQDFVLAKILGDKHAWIGATDEASETKWQWVTGEKWGYEYFYSGFNNDSNQDYLYQSSNDYWNHWYGNDPLSAYICEWSTQNYVATALLPDLNNNGSIETAALYVNYKDGRHTVAIKDTATNKPVKILRFAKNFTPPQGMVVLTDINGNGAPEIAVLYSSSNFSTVLIKDSKSGATLNKYFFLAPTYKPTAINYLPDSNGNGSTEIVVLGVNKRTGKAATEVRDSLNGQILGGSKF